jgi:hypothetical protein
VAAAAAAAVALLGQAPAPRAAAQDTVARSPRNASYQLQASLDASAHAITGTGTLTWRNITSRPVAELRFHLYWNAWRDTNSTWMREQQLGRNRAFARRPASDFGGIEVSRLAIAGRDLRPNASFIAPDDGNADDRTVLAVPLEQPVGPGQTVHVELAWTARVPRTFARTGRIGDYYFIAQWFPKIGVLEEAGWNTHQFHAGTEFFADFGVYDVSLDVPHGWIVGATGVERERIDTGGRTRYRFTQDDVHDFAWTTSPHFLERRARFEDPGLPPVEMRLLLQPEHADQADRHFEATRAALKYFGTWFGPYPFGQITIVDPVTIVNPAAQGEGTRGMEYPTLFTAGTRWSSPWGNSEPEAVTIHETGHQFFQGVVATNEFEHAWMDEGLTTYATARVMEEMYPHRFVTVGRYFGGLAAWSYLDVKWSRAIDGNRLNAFRAAASSDAQSTASWRYWPGTGSLISYNKTALWLATLERWLGWDTVQRILRTHFERGAFRHPTPDEFFAIASEVSGRDLTSFFDAVHRSSATFDYAAGQVTTATRGEERVSTVVVRRLGDGILPVKVRVTAGTATHVFDWDGRDRWTAFEVVDRAPVSRVEVDPERVLALDVNYTNNSWTAQPQAARAATRWGVRWLTWAQELLLTYAFLV